MYKKLSNVDFKYFIGQKVTEVNTEKNLPLGMTFDTAGLIIECPWRLQVSNEVVIGYSDCIQASDRYSHKSVENILLGKRIMNILHFEGISDLVVEFEGSIYLELFHDSSYFEGWQLSGENGFYLFTLPGGTYSV
ncbi:DUF6188 family protein [uncultured Psychrobacillus sp.]|uniref:DUF6188 family protein n=1 Tax=uncultured Psychrobacillus sp. TaxID=1551585 RepID=UPI0026257095|nr:DUF6188 family protein [uncultured Psychrobacillus sp.]